jgi:hypothetical protein
VSEVGSICVLTSLLTKRVLHHKSSYFSLIIIITLFKLKIICDMTIFYIWYVRCSKPLLWSSHHFLSRRFFKCRCWLFFWFLNAVFSFLVKKLFIFELFLIFGTNLFNIFYYRIISLFCSIYHLRPVYWVLTAIVRRIRDPVLGRAAKYRKRISESNLSHPGDKYTV